MHQSYLPRITLIFLVFISTVLTSACHSRQNVRTTVTPQPEPPAPSAAVENSVSQSPHIQGEDSVSLAAYESALDKAAGAFSISQSAQSTGDWNLVASQYREAIAIMQQVKKLSPYFVSAQTKISEYHKQMRYAQKQSVIRTSAITQPENRRMAVTVPQGAISEAAKTQPSPKILPDSRPQTQTSITVPTATPSVTQQQQVFAVPTKRRTEPGVIVAPIKRRVGGTPIIEVTFNGNQSFEMIVDTGASGTVITQAMANALNVVTVGKAKANTASAKAVEFPIAYVDTIAVGGLTVRRVAVAIAGVELETGLLGHDFFGEYEITIKRDSVEFRPPSYSQANPVETGLIPPTSSKLPPSEESP
ncbi:retropepsin-like aspartic protease family protein [Calothrix sp. 336/3]|uniref:retropepsin-like aspartic protease family protein n=1 Tax=Calothrix sp. 336/3 TaxID=1337936 RepID=UPI0004E34035|nr:retropepsin-like aspartic protease [Calothrix sp. 336/3]AKG24021.1 hypothetical protein IJ00_24340 [Calothrix sp. 336/3]